MPLETPSRPWERIGVALFAFNNKDFLITFDYFCNYWEIDKLNNTLASTVIVKLNSHFARYGYLDQVVSDNGPQFDCQEFQKFAETWDVEHTPSSPVDSKANRKAEFSLRFSLGRSTSAVKLRKFLTCIIKKQKKSAIETA